LVGQRRKFDGAEVRHCRQRPIPASGPCILMALMFFWQAPLGYADDHRETVSLRAGYLFFSADGSFARWKEGGVPVYVDLDTVGINDDDQNLFAGVTWNIGDRWALRLDAFGFHNDGTRVANVDFEYGDTAVSIGSRVDGKLDLDIYMLNLGYRFIDRDRWEFGAGAGVHYISLDYGFRTSVEVQGAPVGRPLVEERSDERFPVPNVYTWSSYRFTEQLRLALDGGWLSANYGDYDGQIYFVRAALEYDFSNHLGVGAGYWHTDFDVDRDTGTKLESYNVKLPGPQFYLKARF
jgi:hypothetical protein